MEGGESMMFIGEYRHNIDSKGRIIIPAKLREELGSEVIVTKGFDGCLSIYTIAEWNVMYQKLIKLRSTQKNVRMYIHMMTAKASKVEFDNQGRINIPANLLQMAELVKECVVVGVADHIEIWDSSKWDEYCTVASEQFEDIAESLVEIDF